MTPCPAEEGSRAQLAAEVQRLEQALEEEKRRTSEFLAQLAHELRNPLAPILSGLEAMEIVGLKDPTLESLREVMRRQTEHLIRLVDDLHQRSHHSPDCKSREPPPPDRAPTEPRC
jgi:signal transduction histidine kinase